MKITGAQAIVELLIEQGVDTIFGYPGGQVIPLYDAIYQNKGVRSYPCMMQFIRTRDVSVISSRLMNRVQAMRLTAMPGQQAG